MKRIFAAGFFAVSLMTEVVFAQEVLDNPDEKTLKLLHSKLAEIQPDFEAEARKSEAFRAADEFSRSEVLAKEIDRTRAAWERIPIDAKIVFPVSARLGEYDSSRGGFPLDLFAPGIYINTFPQIRFENSEDFAILKATPDQGRTIIQNLGGSRSLTIVTHLENARVSLVNQHALEMRVSKINVLDARGTQIGTFEAPVAAQKPVIEGFDAEMVNASLSDAFGLPKPGDDWATVEAFLTTQPFSVGHGDYDNDGTFSISNGERSARKEPVEHDLYRVAFGSNENHVNGAVDTMSNRLNFHSYSNLKTGVFGQNLDCSTPNDTDICGVISLRKIDDKLVVADITALRETDQMRYDEEDKLKEVIDSAILVNMEKIAQPISYSVYDVTGQGSQSEGAAAIAYVYGNFVNEGARIHDPYADARNKFSADAMLWIIDGGDRTILMTRSALAEDVATQAAPTPAAPTLVSPVPTEELYFSEAMALPGVEEKVRSLAAGQDEWLEAIFDRGTPQSRGREIIAGGKPYKYYFTCWPQMCRERSVGLMIGPQGEIYLQAYGDYAKYGGYVLGTDSPWIEELMVAQR